MTLFPWKHSNTVSRKSGKFRGSPMKHQKGGGAMKRGFRYYSNYENCFCMSGTFRYALAIVKKAFLGIPIHFREDIFFFLAGTMLNSCNLLHCFCRKILLSNQNKIYVNLKSHKISIISSQCSENFWKNTKVTNYNMKPIKFAFLILWRVKSKKEL